MSSKQPNEDFLLTKSVKTFKLYNRRWFILFLYVLYAGINSFQWFEYSIITNVIMRFYKVSAVEVDWTSIIYMLLYMPMVVPASYLMEKIDLRQIAIIGVVGTALGTTLKIFSLSPNRMWVTYLAQTILSSMQVFILALPPRIASVWFGPKEVSSACALGVFGTQLGQAIGFIVPPMVVKNHEDVREIQDELKTLVYGLAGFTVIVTLAVFIYFSANPPTPSKEFEDEKKESFLNTLKKLLTDKSFNFLVIAYGINIAVFVSISTLLNQFLLFYFKNSEEDAGCIGLLMVVVGMIGAIAVGFILDKTQAYKSTTLVMYILSAVSVIAFIYCLESCNKVYVYISGAAVGLFINSYMPLGLELAVELTYPYSESTSSGILISMTQTLGVIFTLLLGYLFSKFGCFWALTCMVFFLIIGIVLTTLISNRTKRQDSFKQANIQFH